MNLFLPAYSVGALLYCPANNAGIVNSLVNEKFGKQFSLALCLEDTIQDNCVADAENILVSSLQALQALHAQKPLYLPKIFIRIRNQEQAMRLLDRLKDAQALITGFNIPKFSLGNADAYLKVLAEINRHRENPCYMMPILESPDLVHLLDRANILYSLKEKLDSISQYVLNIRVGGNDLCHRFGFRRRSNETIYKIRPVADIFSDIITVFGMDYVVSGPVFEYYDGKDWEAGLEKELDEDRLCGFIGKTVIHPNQIRLVNEAYKVPLKDYNDAKAILGWDANNPSLVAGSIVKERMNEYKTHYNWALRTLLLAEAYGLK